VGPGTGLDDVEKRKFLTLPVLELRPLGQPRSQSLYRLLKLKVDLTFYLIRIERVETQNKILYNSKVLISQILFYNSQLNYNSF
jgi:hypothetical protein